MDQKNTIVKCKAHPDCLFNYHGVCDNYVINIDTDGKCECYIETASKEDMKNGIIGEYKTINATCGDCEYFGNIDNCPVYKRTHVLFGMNPICLDFQFRDQRAKCNVYDDACNLTFCNPNCVFCTIKKDLYYCMLKKSTIDAFGFICSKYKEEK